ncbi:hypothetical protein WN51_10822 [Melipona quadrifasciata]|uniref:Uncharacterized protein n=1 Tax=Melipona quadrifasciata TaxID=166423 RepID=A0A0M9A5N2_9HYME|nr:hypothetical protein WN51_10822 [Melipona quadrifasciata]
MELYLTMLRRAYGDCFRCRISEFGTYPEARRSLSTDRNIEGVKASDVQLAVGSAG